MNVLIIDNLDSFTFNLVEAFERLGCDVQVLRNSVPPEEALATAREKQALIVLSPGPGQPRDAGCCPELIRIAEGQAPLLGVCLGHQAIVEQSGGRVVRSPEPVHGKAVWIAHDGAGPLAGLASPIAVGRYHSLCTRALPDRFTVHAEIDGMAMVFSDAEAMQTGLQFHPESILTPHGDAILRNVLEQAQLSHSQLAEQKTVAKAASLA